MNNNENTSIQDMINKIPITLYFEGTPDRQHALKYVLWLYDNIPESKTVNQDKLFRQVISRELRVISMKIIEIEILIMVGLDKITLNDFTLDSDSLLKKVLGQNPDKYDLDMMYRVMAQIMTKLPRDLRDQVAGKHKLQVFQKISKFINLEPKLLEKFINMDSSLNTPVTMDLDSGDYNTLNKKYLNELKNYQESQPYLDSDTLENIKTLKNNIKSTPSDAGILKAQYIDDKPILMMGDEDSKLYYYDQSSGTISEIPVYENQTPVTIDDLNSILSANKVKQSDIQSLIDSINNPTTAFVPNVTEQPAGLFTRIGKFFTGGSPVTNSSNAPLITNMSTQSPVIPQYLLNLKYNRQNDNSSQQNDNSSYQNNNNDNSSQQNDNSSQQDRYYMQQYYNSLKKFSEKRLKEEKDSQAKGDDSQAKDDDNQAKRYYMQQYYNSLLQDKNGEKQRQYAKQLQQYYNSLKKGSTSQNNSSYNPNPSYTFKSSIYSSLYQQNDKKHSKSLKNSQDKNFKLLNGTYEHNPTTTRIEPFINLNSNSTNITEAELIKNMKKNNENIENVALSFVTIIILLFLLVIFNAIRNKSGLSK